LRHSYDAGDQRVVKEAVDALGERSYTLYVFETLELRRTQFGDFGEGDGVQDYEVSNWTVVPYLLANGVRLARLVYEGAGAVPEEASDSSANSSVSQIHVFFELGDHLGSTSVVLDKATSELVERSTFQGYGGTESDYRPERWKKFREDYKFTGKEEDSEVGLQYFEKRYLSVSLNRWISSDPLSNHQPGQADLNGYAYVAGRILKNIDPLGLAGIGADPMNAKIQQEYIAASDEHEKSLAEAKKNLDALMDNYLDVLREKGDMAAQDKAFALVVQQRQNIEDAQQKWAATKARFQELLDHTASKASADGRIGSDRQWQSERIQAEFDQLKSHLANTRDAGVLVIPVAIWNKISPATRQREAARMQLAALSHSMVRRATQAGVITGSKRAPPMKAPLGTLPKGVKGELRVNRTASWRPAIPGDAPKPSTEGRSNLEERSGSESTPKQ
jgi:RHS repeat-associated protein